MVFTIFQSVEKIGCYQIADNDSTAFQTYQTKPSETHAYIACVTLNNFLKLFEITLQLVRRSSLLIITDEQYETGQGGSDK